MDLEALRARLEHRHPDVSGELGAAWWRLLSDAYAGTGGFRTAIHVTEAQQDSRGPSDYDLDQERLVGPSYLIRYPRERAEAFSRRAKVTTYRNFVQPVVDEYHGHLWKRPPQRASDLPAVTAWWEDVDGRGTGIDAWMREGSHAAALHGWRAAYLDRPEGEFARGQVATVARWLDPEELIDWETDGDGALVWARLYSETHSRDPWTGEESERYVYTTWTRDEWERVELEEQGDRYTLVDAIRQPHALGRVPLVVLRYADADCEVYGQSLVDGIVAASVEHYNLTSELREWERGQCFGILCVQSANPNVLGSLRVGVHGGIAVEPGMGFPAYVAPPTEVGGHLRTRLAEVKADIYEMASLERPGAEIEISGISRAYKVEQMGARLQSFARRCEAFEREIVSLLAAWDSEDPEVWQAASRVEYAARFDAVDLRDSLQAHYDALGTADALVPETSRAARLVIGSALNPQATPSERAALAEQVEARYQQDLAAFELRLQTIPDAGTVPPQGETVPTEGATAGAGAP